MDLYTKVQLLLKNVAVGKNVAVEWDKIEGKDNDLINAYCSALEFYLIKNNEQIALMSHKTAMTHIQNKDRFEIFA